MFSEFDEQANKPIPGEAVPGESASDILLAGCAYSNPLMCNYGANPHVTETINNLMQTEKIPNENAPITAEASAIQNPGAQSSDPMDKGINALEQKFKLQNVFKGNDEKIVMQGVFQDAATSGGNANIYAEVATDGAATGEMYMSYGSRIPQNQQQVDTEKHTPYVLKDTNYDLGSIALDDLDSARAAINAFELSMPGIPDKDLDVPKNRIDYDINKIIGTKHDMSTILDQLSGPPVYKQYSDRFDAWRNSIKSKIGNPDQHVIYYDTDLLGPEAKAQYQAKANRDLALIDMAMIQNDTGNRQELLQEVSESLKAAAELDPNNPDLQQLQDLSKKL